MQRCRLIDWHVHDPLMHQPLDLMEQRFALAPVALNRLLAEELIDICIAPIGIGSRAQHIGLDTGGGIA